MPLKKLGDIPIETFLNEYWQKKPLLIRQAYPGFELPIDGDELAGLALEEEVESRLILEHGKTPWELRNGPFEEDSFSQLPESHWTLLVQAVDQWVPEIHELLKDFHFIPSWRLDDIMLSYAADQGSVGPHFDYYDVFLLQGMGKRRWHIGQPCDNRSELIDGTPLKLLKHFETCEEWLLEPGDMLYIPPGIAHWGVAEGECITCSIGFRAPSHADILSELSQDIASGLNNDLRYSDPDLVQPDNTGAIDKQAIARIREIIHQHLTDEKIIRWFGSYMTERKYIQAEPTETDEESDDWQAQLSRGALLWRHPAARFAYYDDTKGAQLFVDGQALSCSRALAELLCRENELDHNQLQAALVDERDHAVIQSLINQESLLLDNDG